MVKSFDRTADLATAEELTDEFVCGTLLSLLLTGGKPVLDLVTGEDAEREVLDYLALLGVDKDAARPYVPELVRTVEAARETTEKIDRAGEKADTGEAWNGLPSSEDLAAEEVGVGDAYAEQRLEKPEKTAIIRNEISPWDFVTPTQPNYPGTNLPRSFIIKTAGETLWVHANSTEHMADYLIKQLNTGHSQSSIKLSTQLLLYDMQQSLSVVIKDGISFGQKLHHGNGDFVINKAKDGEPYHAVIHALLKNRGALMKYSNTTNKRTLNPVDYIPIQLRTKGECRATDYYIINKGDRSLLEFAFNHNDSVVHRITLLICEDYRKIKEMYCIPDSRKNGDVLIEASGDIDSPTFQCEIYPNAVKIVVSDADSSECVFSENVVWELSDHGDLVSICVLDPTGEVSNHCFRELEANRQ